jgi:flagellar hook assembly protein FlgD
LTAETICQLDSISAVATGIPGETPAAIPAGYILYTAAPNPSTDRTTIRFDLPETTPVSLDIYDVSGRLVRRLAGGEAMAGGRYAFDWDGRNHQGDPVAGGVYMIRLVTRPGGDDARTVTSKVVINRGR